jgi:CheY-specific phosphatase CheX
MTRYFFHLRDQAGFLQDEEGRELDGLAQVHDAALKEARAIIAEDAKQGHIHLGARIDVTSPAGDLVLSMSFEEAVEINR